MKSLRIAVASVGMLVLAGTAASAADFRLANPAAGQGLVTKTAMGVVPLASENPVVKTQRRGMRGGGGGIRRGGGGAIRRGGFGGGPRFHSRRRGVGKGVAIGLGVAAAAAIIGSAAANAGSYRRGPSCSRLYEMCYYEGRGWACRRYRDTGC